MDGYYYRHVVILLLAYLTTFAFVLAVELLSLGALLGTLVLGSVLGLGLLGVLE